MDGYAESMLHDDVSSGEEVEIQCPGCQQIVRFKTSDQFIKCKRCGEIFYIEDITEGAQQY